VVDANILFSALIKNGATRKILLLSDYNFFVPDYSFWEFKKHLTELQRKTGLNKKELNSLLNELIEFAGINTIQFNEFNYLKNLAEKISPDPDDVAYIALAAHLDCAIWSNDKELKKQNKIKIISTKELIHFFHFP
jgi:predicted nucleic acid-binding protein